MDNKGLIFIPDISGFTRFVKEVEIDHSRHIIQELLEVIINANHLGLKISEIEGDAILFYKYGDTPGLKEVYEQVEKMFCEFHNQLHTYDHRKFCNCKACTGAANLTLKIITHYGEFTEYNVKKFNKLIGKDIIVAHQLLKNDIEQHEYWLVTDELGSADLPDQLNWQKSIKQTEAGTINFQYAQLGHLKNKLPPVPRLDLEIKNKVKVISFYREYEADIITLLHAVVDYHTRKRWNVAIKDIDNVTHDTIPRLGSSHRCLLEKGQSILYSSSYSFSPDKIEYGETDDKKLSSIHFTFTRINDQTTGLTVDLYIRKNPIVQTFFNLIEKKKTEKMFNQSLSNLKEFVKEVKIPSTV